MLNAGDEFARTQLGNNNTYCQDNELNWFNWNWDDEAKSFFDFTKKADPIPERASGLSTAQNISRSEGSVAWK